MGERKEGDKGTKGIKKRKKGVPDENMLRNCLHVQKLHKVHLLYTSLKGSKDRGRAITQAVSRWLPTAATRVRSRSGHMGFMVGKVALRQVFLRVLQFPLPIFFQPNSPS
jgi:hypothetical protein